MTDFQVTIIPAAEPVGQVDAQEDKFRTVQHGKNRGKKIEASIDNLAGVWDTVVDKLTLIAAKTNAATTASKFELDSIEFNIGIEAGLSVGLVTKGNASVSISFKKKGD